MADPLIDWHEGWKAEEPRQIFGGAPGAGLPFPPDLVRATPATWKAWASAERAQLWQYAALAVGLEPDWLDWRAVLNRQEEQSVAGAFARVVRQATLYVEHSRLRCETIEAEIPLSVVGYWQFVEWCDDKGICLLLPNEFPDGDPAKRPSSVSAPVPLIASAPEGAVEPKPKKKRVRGATGVPSGYVAMAQLAKQIVPMSAANIYRMILAGEFPPSYQFGKRSAAWNRLEIDEWLRQREAAGRAKVAEAERVRALKADGASAPAKKSRRTSGR